MRINRVHPVITSPPTGPFASPSDVADVAACSAHTAHAHRRAPSPPTPVHPPASAPSRGSSARSRLWSALALLAPLAAALLASEISGSPLLPACEYDCDVEVTHPISPGSALLPACEHDCRVHVAPSPSSG